MYHDFSVRSRPLLFTVLTLQGLCSRINNILDKPGEGGYFNAVLGHSYLYELESISNIHPWPCRYRIFILPNLVEILMREQVSNEDLSKTNKELRTIGFKIVDEEMAGQMKLSFRAT